MARVLLRWLLLLEVLLAAADSSTTTTAILLVTPAPGTDCSLLRKDCSGCLAAGCRFCQAGAEVGPFYDFVCFNGVNCLDLTVLRAQTGWAKTLSQSDCDRGLKYPTTTTTSTTSIAPFAGLQALKMPTLDTSGWSWQWVVLFVPLGLAVILTALGSWFCWKWQLCGYHWRVKIAPSDAVGPATAVTGAAVWDFREARTVGQMDLEGIAKALAEAAAKGSRQPRVLQFDRQNDLKDSQLHSLAKLLDEYPELSICFDADLRSASEKTLIAMATLLLPRRGRCKFRESASCSVSNALRLPMKASSAALGAMGEAIAAAQAEVDNLTMETVSSDRNAPFVTVPLAPLRMGVQDFTLSRHKIGDQGCAAACGFVRGWVSRLTVARFLECDLGDEGGVSLARLLGGGMRGAPPAIALKELTLSANRIGDRAIAELAEALPRLDNLERLLMDRNQIGLLGAQALAMKLPRSNVRELVLGSHLGGNPIGPKGVEALASALDDYLARAAANRATRLSALSLEDCGAGEEGAKALAAKLPKSALAALSVARGRLGDAGAQAILRALPNTIVSLDLAGNGLTDSTASLVGEVLYRIPEMAVSLAQNSLSPVLKGLLTEEHGARLRV